MVRMITSPCGCREAYVGPTDDVCVEWSRCGTHAKPKDVAKTEKAKQAAEQADPDDLAYVQFSYAVN